MLLSFVGKRRLIKYFSLFISLGLLILFLSSFISICILGWKTPYIWMFLLSLFLNYVVSVCISIQLLHFKKYEPLFANCYLLIFLMFPFLGIFMYSLFDFDFVHKNYSGEFSQLFSKYTQFNNSKSFLKNLDKTNSLARPFLHNYQHYKIPIYRGVNVFVLDNSYKILNELIYLISGARKCINMEFYLFSDGLVFRYIYETLRRKIQEGVEVRLIIDYWGNIGRIKRRTIKDLEKIGVNVKIFNRVFKFTNLCWQFRNHNKVVVVDNKYAWFGSCNIADEYFNITDRYFQTTELSIKLSGEIVRSVNSLFLSHWELSGGEELKNEVEAFENEEELDDSDDHSIAQFVENSPISNDSIIRDNLMQLIMGAKRNIVISTPYFFPPDELIEALKLVRSSGVTVKILVPQNPDLIDFFRTLNSQKFEMLLYEGIEVYEYLGFNHEKLMIVDEEIVYCGSYNWDYRSLYLNFENALLLKCPKVASKLYEFMNEQFSNSHKIVKEDLKRFKGFIFFKSFVRLFKAFL